VKTLFARVKEYYSLKLEAPAIQAILAELENQETFFIEEREEGKLVWISNNRWPTDDIFIPTD
jgi:uncharacterized protein (DUF736 family)